MRRTSHIDLRSRLSEFSSSCAIRLTRRPDISDKSWQCTRLAMCKMLVKQASVSPVVFMRGSASKAQWHRAAGEILSSELRSTRPHTIPCGNRTYAERGFVPFNRSFIILPLRECRGIQTPKHGRPTSGHSRVWKVAIDIGPRLRSVFNCTIPLTCASRAPEQLNWTSHGTEVLIGFKFNPSAIVAESGARAPARKCNV